MTLLHPLLSVSICTFVPYVVLLNMFNNVSK